MSGQSKLPTPRIFPKLPLPNLGGRFFWNHSCSGYSQRIGEYDVLGKLGSGGFGYVFLVQDDKGNRFVLKVSHSKYKRYLKMEFDIGRLILSPCFVPALELFEDGEFTCLLFEYIPGQTLTHFMRTHRSMKDKKLIVQQLALAIAHLHGDREIVHLDLKPDNILIVISPQGIPQVRIIDFGLALPFAMLASGSVGTKGYKAPEVESGFEYDQKADIWSLGMIISFILTGQVSTVTGTHPKNVVPFRVCTLMQPPIPEQMNSDPEMAWALQLCQACLAIDPNARASAMELVQMCASLKFD